MTPRPRVFTAVGLLLVLCMPHGAVQAQTIRSGRVAAAADAEEHLRVRLDANTDLLVFRTTYVNTGDTPVTVGAMVTQQYELSSSVDSASGRPTFWTFQGISCPSRADWVLPLGADAAHYRGVGPAEQLSEAQRTRFERYNYLGMNATDYGGGVPVLDVWTPEGGLAIGPLSPAPELAALPLRMTDRQTVQMQFVEPHALPLCRSRCRYSELAFTPQPFPPPP